MAADECRLEQFENELFPRKDHDIGRALAQLVVWRVAKEERHSSATCLAGPYLAFTASTVCWSRQGSDKVKEGQ